MGCAVTGCPAVSRVTSIARLVALLLALAGTADADNAAPPFSGQSVSTVLEALQDEGLPLVFSSDLVPTSLLVDREPASRSRLAIAREILAAHELRLRRIDGVYVVVRSSTAEKRSTVHATLLVAVVDGSTGLPLRNAAVDLSPASGQPNNHSRGAHHYPKLHPGTYAVTVSADGYTPSARNVTVKATETKLITVRLVALVPVLEQMVVSSSRYQLMRDLAGSLSYFDRRAIESMPDVGNDPMRTVQRLPGSAGGGFSAKPYIRGGNQDETGIILNGQRVLDPFHVRDFQSIFSAIDARAINGVEVYTGGFPVEYGDQLSGLILIEPLNPDRPVHTEIGVSVFNTSLLSAGIISHGDADWVVSARRGNLDLIIDPKFGEPKYTDLFASLGVNFSPATRLSVNALVADDDVLVIAEPNPDEREDSLNRTRNAQFWLRLENQWSSDLSSSTVLSTSDLDSRRIAVVNDPEKIIGNIDDRRRVNISGISQQWQFTAAARHLLKWGVEFYRRSADYEYAGSVDYFGFFDAISDTPSSIRRNIELHPDGESLAVYLSDRWRIGPSSSIELGARWDKQSYASLPGDAQFSPRFSFLHSLTRRTQLRLSWGRYFQSQGIDEIQVEDGVSSLFPAQRSDHLIVGLQHRFPDSIGIRAEVFHKDLHGLRPRFENLFDPFTLLPEFEPGRVRIAPERGTVRGVELTLDRRTGEDFSWWASYSLARAEDVVDGSRIARSWDQRNAFQAGLALTRGPWDFGAAIHLHSGWPTTGLTLNDDNGALEAVPGPRNGERLGNFASLDLRVNRRFDVGTGTLSVFFEVSNATARDNPCCVDFDLDIDTAGNTSLDRKVENWLPLLPAIGVRWEF